MKDDRERRAEQRARKKGEQFCYVKFLLGPFHLTKPSVVQWFAAPRQGETDMSGTAYCCQN